MGIIRRKLLFVPQSVGQTDRQTLYISLKNSPLFYQPMSEH